MATKFTKGPWEDNGAGLIYGQVGGDDDDAPFVCDVCNEPGSGKYTDQEQANSCLITAAFEMYRALKEGEDIISGLEAACDNAGVGDLVEVRDWWNKALKILAKAEGRTV